MQTAIDLLNEFLWSRVAFALVIGLGGYFSLRSGFFQVRRFPQIVRTFISFFRVKTGAGGGIHPLKAFFAAIGGCIGIGNIVGICTAVEIGGPGALFWTWVGGLAGMLIQYSEIYLGMKTRVPNRQGSFDGGPMYFLPKAFHVQWIAPVVCFLLAFYGVEIFMFNVMVESIAVNWEIDKIVVTAALLIATLSVALGGINRVGEVCSALIPLFILLYIGMGCFLLYTHWEQFPAVLGAIFKGAFTYQAAEGAFAGSAASLTISMGLSRGAYSGDIGIGYNAVIHAESSTRSFGKQASLGVVAIFIDTFVICTLSIFIVLLTGEWKSGIGSALMVQEALSYHFPYMNFFMPLFLFLLGYTTILAYFVVGVKCARFLSPRYGPPLYYAYAAVALPLFAFVDPASAFSVMSLAGAALLICNLIGMFMLRHEVRFELDA
jgi:AGCS family alanine or glycine:cation symporter